jgi:hypothetical protein
VSSGSALMAPPPPRLLAAAIRIKEARNFLTGSIVGAADTHWNIAQEIGVW